MAKVEHDGVVRLIVIALKCHQHILFDFEFDIGDFRVSLENVSISRDQFSDCFLIKWHHQVSVADAVSLSVGTLLTCHVFFVVSHVNESRELCFEVGVFGY